MNLYETVMIFRKLNLVFFVLLKNVNQVYTELQFNNFNLLCPLFSGMAGSVLGEILKLCDTGTSLAGDDLFSVVF